MALVLLEFLLHWMADIPGRPRKQEKEEEMIPMVNKQENVPSEEIWVIIIPLVCWTDPMQRFVQTQYNQYRFSRFFRSLYIYKHVNSARSSRILNRKSPLMPDVKVNSKVPKLEQMRKKLIDQPCIEESF